ncbi:MAG: hypothetical protein ACOC1O_00315 [bacterium]
MNFKTFKEIIFEEINNNGLLQPYHRRESGSFSELLFDSFSMQSINIKMGNILERTWKKYIALSNEVVIDKRNIIEGSQVDILFSFRNIKYYFESKNNLNIDTEKSIATKNKLLKIISFLENENENVVGKILNNRYSTSKHSKNFKLPILEEDIYGYSDLFSIFEVKVSEEQWNDFFKTVGQYIIMKGEK